MSPPPGRPVDGAAGATGAALAGLPFGGPPARGGTVHLVGGGPGDPGLLSVRAIRLLTTADVVAYDRLAPAVALGLCRDDAKLIDVGKLPDRHKLTQDEITALCVEHGQAGRSVVRFKGGDPFVLARGSEEAQACRAAGLDIEVVPGVTSGIAAPAYAGIPVTHRGLTPGFAVVTGHEDPTKDDTQVDYAALARFPGTLLLYMGMGRLGEISAALIAAGRRPDEPCALVEWGTTPRQRTAVGTLATIADVGQAAAIANPAMIVVGDVVALRHEIAWFDTRPLHGVRVLVPRTRHQASELSDRLRALGAEPVEAPTIATEPTSDPDALRRAVARIADGAWDWIGLTSVNGVTALRATVDDLGLDARALAGVRIAAVGSGTATALAAWGLHADLVPDRFTTRGLAEALVTTGPSARILLARADLATAALSATLVDAGWQVDEVEAYRTTPVEALPAGVAEALVEGRIGVCAFASSSTVRNLVALTGGPLDPAVRIASIGPVTSATCRELGLRVDAEADPHDLDGLVDAIVTAATSPTASPAV